MPNPQKMLIEAIIIAKKPMQVTNSDGELFNTLIAPITTMPEIALDTLINGACREGVMPQTM